MSKKNKAEEIKDNLKLFKHRIEGKVRFEDVDLMQVVHNIKYLYWFEFARTEFLREMLYPDYEGNFLSLFPLLIVRNEVDYFGSAHFNEKYTLLTRVAELGKSSITIENVVLLNGSKPIVHCLTTFVHVEADFSASREIPAEFRQKILNFMA